MRILWVFFVYAVSLVVIGIPTLIATVAMMNPHSDSVPDWMRVLILPVAIMIVLGVAGLIANKAWDLSSNWSNSDEPQSRR